MAAICEIDPQKRLLTKSNFSCTKWQEHGAQEIKQHSLKGFKDRVSGKVAWGTFLLTDRRL